MSMTERFAVLWIALFVVAVSGCVSYQTGYVNDTVFVNGTSSARNFSSHVLEIGEGFNPINWSALGVNLTGGGLSPVNESRLGLFDTLYYPDGNYTIRLNVTDAVNVSSTDYVYLVVDNVYLTAPASYSFNRFGDVVEVDGRVRNRFFGNYTIQHTLNSTVNWSSEGVTLTNNGTAEVNNGTLGLWNTSGLNQSGVHEIRVVANYTTGRSNTESVSVILDNYHLGWPLELTGWIFSSPMIADVDGNGTGEIIVGDFMSYLYVLNSDGTDFSVDFPHSLTGDLFGSSAAVADLSRDGHVKVVAATDAGRLYAFSVDGSLGWLQRLNASGYACQVESSPVLDDFNGDGNIEVFIADDCGYAYMFHHNGTPVDGWPATLNGYTVGDTPTVADINGDGLSEVIFLDNGGKLYAFNGSGQMISQTWPISLRADMYISSPVSGDLDGDDVPEIVWGDFNGKVHAINGDGTNVTGWPVNIYPGYVDESTPALVDINSDGKLEVVVASDQDLIHIINASGSILPGWPLNLSDEFESSPVVGDIDGDGRMEVVVGSNSGWVYALNDDGTNLTGWPKFVNDEVGYAPAIGEVDGDGDVEVVACGEYSSYVFVWDLNAPYNASNVAWGMFMHDPQHTGSVPLPTPAVTLLSPADGSVDSDGFVVFSYNASGNGSVIVNCSLYTSVSGIWGLNQTDASVESGANNFTLNLTDNSSLRWNVKCVNTAKRFGFAGRHWVLSVSINPANAPPVLSSVLVENITNESAVLTWNTNTPTNSSFRYGNATNYSTAVSLNFSSANYSLALSGLPQDTRVFYSINATNENNLSSSYDGNFSTALTVLANVNASVNQTTELNTTVNLSILIYANASVSNATINISRFRDNPTNRSLRVRGLGWFYRIDASDDLIGSFSSTLLRFQYTDDDVSASGLNESNLALYWFNGTEYDWQKLNASTMGWVLGTGVNATENFVWANVTHFSFYTVGDSNEAQTLETQLREGWNLVSIPLIL